MESRKEVFRKMNINEVITDEQVLAQHYLLRDGYEFKPLTYPANVYDAIVIKKPYNAICEYPKTILVGHPLSEQIEFINRFKLEKAIIIADDISFMNQCAGLKHLQIIPANGAGNGFDFSPLYELPEIKTLICRTEYGEKEQYRSQIDYSRISGIESLSISGKGHKNYNQIENLRTLGISGYSGKDLTDLFSSKALDTLYMIRCTNQTLEGIQISEKMQCLYLEYNRSLQDISALKTVKKTLRALRIENCPKIKDFSILKELDNLEMLVLLGQNELSDISFIQKMKKLKTFVFSMSVADGNLSPCLELAYAHSINNKRYYNLKDEALPKKHFFKGNENIERWRRFE